MNLTGWTSTSTRGPRSRPRRPRPRPRGPRPRPQAREPRPRPWGTSDLDFGDLDFDPGDLDLDLGDLDLGLKPGGGKEGRWGGLGRGGCRECCRRLSSFLCFSGSSPSHSGMQKTQKQTLAGRLAGFGGRAGRAIYSCFCAVANRILLRRSPMEELAGRPAGFGENIRETFWGAKTSARFLASRPAGRPAGRLR